MSHPRLQRGYNELKSSVGNNRNCIRQPKNDSIDLLRADTVKVTVTLNPFYIGIDILEGTNAIHQ